jgi:hypothetical protein
VRPRYSRRPQGFDVIIILISLQIYLIASSITFGAQALALTDSEFPVWYPYYGTWFAGILVELTLLVVPNVFRTPTSPFDYVVTVIQVLRVGTFIAMPSLYFFLRNDNKEYDNGDAERQTLLGKKIGPKSSEDSAGNGKGYGGTAQDSDTTDTASDAGSEDSWLANQRKAEEMIANRLKQDGNWFTYAKGFAVSLSWGLVFAQLMLNDSRRYSSHTSGRFIARVYSSELFSSPCAYWPRTH